MCDILSILRSPSPFSFFLPLLRSPFSYPFSLLPLFLSSLRYHVRWWFVSRVQEFANLSILRGTPFITWYYRAMGASIGKRVFMNNNISAEGFDLITLGDDVTINIEAEIKCSVIEVSLIYSLRTNWFICSSYYL